MKEATGELNATVIVVISIAILSTFFFTVIWPMLNNNLKSSTRCGDAYCPKKDKKINCESKEKNGKCLTVKCKYYDKSTKKEIDIVCPYKG